MIYLAISKHIFNFRPDKETAYHQTKSSQHFTRARFRQWGESKTEIKAEHNKPQTLSLMPMIFIRHEGA